MGIYAGGGRQEEERRRKEEGGGRWEHHLKSNNPSLTRWGIISILAAIASLGVIGGDNIRGDPNRPIIFCDKNRKTAMTMARLR